MTFINGTGGSQHTRSVLVRGDNALQAVRRQARNFERAIDPGRRKQFGQFFSGLRLGRVLAHFAIEGGTKTVLDPMVGHGDLLDAARDVAAEHSVHLERLDGIEIDEAVAEICRGRLAAVPPIDGNRPSTKVLCGDAFSIDTLNKLPIRSYDLVITNPPYVRYQGQSDGGRRALNVRIGVKEVVESVSSVNDTRLLWRLIAEGYSGLSDLSVPAWILASLMVRQGGRLALIVPATWRTRDYGDIIRYLLLRCFELELVVEDTQPGWFCDALVRTHLIVARRLPECEARVALSDRTRWLTAKWVEIAPEAANQESLVGAAFGRNPESALSNWLEDSPREPVRGITLREFDLGYEWMTLRPRVKRKRWYARLESGGQEMPLFAATAIPSISLIPDGFRKILPTNKIPKELHALEKCDIKVGQGLRTGCNDFFYVSKVHEVDQDTIQVKVSPRLGGHVISVPSDALRPALRNQGELAKMKAGSFPSSHVLDLRSWVLPEDVEPVCAAGSAYARWGELPPRVMSGELCDFVRRAARVSLKGGKEGKRIPELTAVSTNVRSSRNNKNTPRFWYMLPDFVKRHQPQAFVPRVNQNTPFVERNACPPFIVDANFATLWASGEEWSSCALTALLNSVWCRAFMESTGTLLGGGALKLEATHLRLMPLPRFTREHRAALHRAGTCLSRDVGKMPTQADCIVLKALFPDCNDERTIAALAIELAARTRALCAARQQVRGDGGR